MALQRARGDPLAGLSTLLGAERRNYWGGRCGKEKAREEGGAELETRSQRGRSLPPSKGLAAIVADFHLQTHVNAIQFTHYDVSLLPGEQANAF